MSQLKSKGVSAVAILIAAVVALVGLILYAVYITNGGALNPAVLVMLIAGILLELSLLFLSGDLADFVAIRAPGLLVIGAALELGDGIGNIADWASGIICFGNPDLAESNLAITGTLMGSVLISIIACFMRRDSQHKPA